MRLIDADSLFNKLFVRNGKELPDNGYRNVPLTFGTKYIKEAIRNEPTAYDVDKVVEWIESERKEAESYGQSSVAIAHEIDIEIVKSGGIE